MRENLRVAQIGNFEPPHSTENELSHALHQIEGVSVDSIQEQTEMGWDFLIAGLKIPNNYDMVLWTSTRSLAAQIPVDKQRAMIETAALAGVPTVGYHLDRWWNLHANRRQEQMWDEYGQLRPFFEVQTLFTADGGHQDEWAKIGVNHIWMPPGVSERWCVPGTPRPEYACDVVFVGGWDGYGHTEWKHRTEMIYKLSEWYGDRFLALPRRGQPRITGLDLNDVYWSAKVVVGDSCLVPKVDGSPMTHYCSDRIPETMGRGGVLLHPKVEGVSGVRDWQFPHCSWPLGDWGMLRKEVDALIELPEAKRQRVRDINMECVKANHTYTHRMRSVLNQVLGWSE